MIRLKNILAVGVLAIPFSIAGIAHAQYVVTGTTPSGGNIVVGSGTTLDRIVSGDGILSSTGGDMITITAGSVAFTDEHGATIKIATPNNTLINNGNIQGGESSDGETDAGVGVSFISADLLHYPEIPLDTTSITGETVINNGLISGVLLESEATIVGTGLSFFATGSIQGININNTGTITGAYTFADAPAVQGGGVSLFSESSSITGVTLVNSGHITSGYFSEGDALVLDTAVSIAAAQGVYNVNITNTSTGIIVGGNWTVDDENDEFEGPLSIGSGISIFDLNQTLGDINGVTIFNAGKIYGGNHNEDAWNLGTGIGIVGFGNVENISITNTGLIQGGNANSNAEYSGVGIGIASVFPESPEAGIGMLSNVTINNAAGATIAGGVGNDDGDAIGLEGDTAITGVTINNAGNISGGAGSTIVEDTNGGDGIFFTGGLFSNITINNFAGGTIAGGNGSANGGDGENGIEFQSEPDDLGVSSGVTINNFGLISGGAGHEDGEGGNGIQITVFDNQGITVTNWGTIKGGAADADGEAGSGVVVGENEPVVIPDVPEGTDNVTINNWGVIAAGAGPGPHDAVVIDGNNNTLNLLGHSSLQGNIVGIGTNNVLNIAFTGVSPAQQAYLATVLKPYLTGGPSDGTFTFRGVTYTWDPMNVQFHPSSYQMQNGGSTNTASIGAALDDPTTNPTGPALSLVNAIDNSGNVPGAIEELSPQKFQIYGDIALATSNFNTLEIDHRLNNLRDGSETIDTMGAGGDNVALTSGLSKDDSKDSKVIQQAAPEDKRWGFFASGNAIFTNIDARGDLQNSGFTTAGMMMGLDGKINDRWVVGTFFDYEHTTADLDSEGSLAHVDTFGGGLYAGYHNGGYYGNGLLAYSRNNYDSSRVIGIPGFDQTANGSTAGNQYEANIDGGYDFHLNDKVTWGPILGLQYVNLGVNGFSENGAGPADLTIGGQNVNSLRSRLGFRIDYHKQIAKEMAFATEVRAEYQHEFLDDSESMDAAFATGPGFGGFAVRTTAPQRDSALVGIGANFTVHDRMTLFFDYDVQAGQQSYLEQSVKGGLKFSF